MKRIVGAVLIVILLAAVCPRQAHAANASALVVALINTVKSLKLQQGIEKSLLAKVRGAQEALLSAAPGYYKTSVEKLSAFKSEANAQTGKHLTQAQADALLAQADNLIGLISNTKAQSVGTSGGLVEVTDPTSPIYGTSVWVPQGALAQGTLMTVVLEPAPPPVPTNVTASGPAVTFGPEGLSFSTPVTIAVPYTEQPGIDENTLKLYTFNGFSETWEEVPVSRRDTGGNILYAEVTHFSTFQAAGQSDTLDPDAPHFDWAILWSTTFPPSTPGVGLYAAAEDPNGSVPDTIQSVRVTGPNGFSYDFIKGDYFYDVVSKWYNDRYGNTFKYEYYSKFQTFPDYLPSC